MIKRLLKLIQEALNKMFATKDIKSALNLSIDTISNDMQDNIDIWRKMYKNKSPWIDAEAGIYSLNLAKQICKELQQQVLSELKTHIGEPGIQDEELDEDKQQEDVIDTRAKYLNNIYNKRFLQQLPNAVEKGLALGGMIIKPYFSNNTVYYDYCYQGEFYPIAFDDDGNIIDIAFYDSFTADNYIYTKIERQRFDSITHTILVTNKAFKAKMIDKDDETEQDLGNEIPLTSVDKWANLSPEVPIENVEKPLYGYFKVPTANNIDLNSPLGVSIFSPAIDLIRKADEQFSRLDWEYNGGQLAIDIDPSAIQYSKDYFGTSIKMDECQKRLYRNVDLGVDNTYNAWAPGLRDANYINGLNAYLCKIEDIIGLARGTLSQINTEARTATEIKILKQRTYITVTAIQEALGKAVKDIVYATNVLVDLYNLAPQGDYDTVIEWQDSILTDTETELQQMLNLKREGIISKAEIRAWYKGEPLEKAQQEIAEMEKFEQQKQLADIYSGLPQASLENNGKDDETNNKNNK